jgi:hypothetical protein
LKPGVKAVVEPAADVVAPADVVAALVLVVFELLPQPPAITAAATSAIATTPLSVIVPPDFALPR